MDTLDTKFFELKYSHFKKSQVMKGFLTITTILKPITYLKFFGELITTFIFYAPSVCSYTKDIISAIRSNWERISEDKRTCIIAALTQMNKHGEIDRVLNKS